MGITFEWDGRKAVSNLRKHKVGFEEASTAFLDPRALSIPDPTHSRDEPRLLLLGMTYHVRIVVVVHTERDDVIRIISARLATPMERRTYAQE
jgi:uncharacterized DUF497 family protein